VGGRVSRWRPRRPSDVPRVDMSIADGHRMPPIACGPLSSEGAARLIDGPIFEPRKIERARIGPLFEGVNQPIGGSYHAIGFVHETQPKTRKVTRCRAHWKRCWAL
jgi:hypothetical protein